MRKILLLDTPIVEWWSVVSKQARTAHLHEQMNKVKRTMNQLPYIMFAAMVLSALSLAISALFGLPWLNVGAGISVITISSSLMFIRYAKEQYNDLFEQLKEG